MIDQQKRENVVRWLHFHSPETLREYSISRRQRLALAIIQRLGSINSLQLSNHLNDCAVREASTLLKDLHTKDYVTRIEKANPTGTGGFVFEYSLSDSLKYEASI